MWRLYKYSNVKDGASPYVLLSIFKTWILPHFEYGACVWIFYIFDEAIHMDREPSSGYISLFNRLSVLYYKCLKIVLGVPLSTCNISVCVRVGVLPLRYHLALRSLVWYIRGYHGLASTMVRDQLFSFYADDEVWGDSCFYAPSYRMLLRLSNFSEENFWNPRFKISKVAVLIRETIFSKLNIFWQ